MRTSISLFHRSIDLVLKEYSPRTKNDEEENHRNDRYHHFVHSITHADVTKGI
jgi:hypothetical protein